MQTHTETSTGKKNGKGKTTEKDKPQEGVIKLDPLRESLPELERACQRKIDASDDFSNACDAVALKAGLDPAVVKSYVTARVRDKLDEYEKKSTQLALVFEGIEA